jgi:hypothetical protein
MKKFKELFGDLQKNTNGMINDYAREDFISGKLFSLGDIVESNVGKAEIISIGTNYVTLIKDGKSYKSWITDIRLLEKSKTNSNINIILKENNLIFKGYNTRNFSRELSEKFQDIIALLHVIACLQ